MKYDYQNLKEMLNAKDRITVNKAKQTIREMPNYTAIKNQYVKNFTCFVGCPEFNIIDKESFSEELCALYDDVIMDIIKNYDFTKASHRKSASLWAYICLNIKGYFRKALYERAVRTYPNSTMYTQEYMIRAHKNGITDKICIQTVESITEALNKNSKDGAKKISSLQAETFMKAYSLNGDYIPAYKDIRNNKKVMSAEKKKDKSLKYIAELRAKNRTRAEGKGRKADSFYDKKEQMILDEYTETITFYNKQNQLAKEQLVDSLYKELDEKASKLGILNDVHRRQKIA